MPRPQACPSPFSFHPTEPVGSIWRTLTAPRLIAVVSFGEPQLAQGRGRREWAADLREAVGNLRKDL